MLMLDVSHRVLRTDTVLDFLLVPSFSSVLLSIFSMQL